MSDDDLHEILTRVTRVACIGASTDPARPSHGVGTFLSQHGYDVWPVNPRHAGERLFGHEIVSDLADLPEGIEMLDIFRRSEHVPEIVDAALRTMPDLKVVWMQIGVRHEAAARTARDAGLAVVMDRCPKIEYRRLVGN